MTPMIKGYRCRAAAILASAACASGGGGSGAPRGTAAPAPAATTTAPPAAPPAVRVFVTNEASGDLTVIDAATQAVIATAPLGKRPRGIKASPDRKTLYVAL